MLNILKKTFITFLFFFFFCLPKTTYSQDNLVNVYIFHGTGCPHCAKELDFLQEVSTKYQQKINIYQYEIYYSKSNAQIFEKVAENIDVKIGGVPFVVIGDQPIIGYGTDQTTGKEILNRIDFCLKNSCYDTTYKIVNPQESDKLAITNPKTIQAQINQENTTKTESLEKIISLPILGPVNTADISLPIITFIIAFMDGFNPCALWILIFLITMLINMKDRKKLYILGSVFIVTSALVYFVFLAAWFNFFQYVGYVYWIKVIIGLVALTTGFLHIKNALKNKGGCHATNEKQRESIIEKIKTITKENNFRIAITGMIILAISVNFVEVVCSAGLPAVYTNLLASANLTTPKYYAYLIFYVLIFMLDDLIIFFIAIKSFQATGITNKYSKFSSIFGGIIMIIIGTILILKPELLMFG